ncbi:MAG TPA: sulfite exporter TauE/SafE family protein [Gammaproteobacteria bacterium]|nr:sulfite exporter TauE/SafE family protein [Gammaproteobacteria bacterium]
MEHVAYLALGATAGLLIGSVGIGGVILVPALVYLAGQSFPTAIAAAMCAFIASGLVGAYAYWKAGSLRFRMTAWTWAGALPCAFAGALLVNVAAPALLELMIGLLTAGAGLYALAGRRDAQARRERSLSAPALTVIGAGTGFLSALTGTGGPLVLISILVSLDVPMLAALGLAQAIQLPVAAAATGSNALAGTLDVPMALTLAGGIAIGTWIGAKAAHALPTDALRKSVALVLVLVGGAMLVRLAAS